LVLAGFFNGLGMVLHVMRATSRSESAL